MRVLAAGFQHEANTFAGTVSGERDFERGDFFPAYARGPAMLERHAGGGMPMAGFLLAAARAGWDVVPSCWAGASPSAAVSRAAFERVRDALREDAVAAGRLDGVYLDLHGAAVAEHLDRPDLELLREVRGIVGPDVPIVASLDLHANVDADLLEVADYLTAYRTYPHVDMVQTGERAAALLSRGLRAEREPVAMRRIPFLIPVVAQTTLRAPAASVMRSVERAEAQEDCAPSFTPGFPAADVAHCGPTVWAYGPNARTVVDALAAEVEAARDAWRPSLHAPADAVQRALDLCAAGPGLVVLADVQDNPGAGADGSTTGLLNALLQAQAGRRLPHRVAVGLLCDADAVAKAAEAGVGATLSIEVGSPPLTLTAHVRALGDGRATLTGPMMHGTRVDMGPTACLEVDGILVGLASARTQTLDRALLRATGIDPDTLALVAIKSAVHFRADFPVHDDRVLLVKAPGAMAADPADLPWEKLRDGVSVTP